jgi:hypothetical protein
VIVKAQPIAARNTIEMTETGAVTIPEREGVLREQRILEAVTQLMGKPGPGSKHVINVVEIHRNAWVAHLTAPANKACETVAAYFKFTKLDTLGRSVPSLVLDWMNARKLTQQNLLFKEFYALNANYFNFPAGPHDNRKGTSPDSCVRPLGPYGDPAEVKLNDQLDHLFDMVDNDYPTSPLILFNNGKGLQINAYHHGAPPTDGGTQWKADYVKAVEASHNGRGAAIISGVSLVLPGGKVPESKYLGAGGDKQAPRIAVAWNVTRTDYPLAIISWHTALSKKPQMDDKLAGGPTLMKLAEVVKALGYTEALNLDGSGSSQLIYGGVDSVVFRGPRAMIPLNIDNKYTYYNIGEGKFADPKPVNDPSAIDEKTFALPRPVPNGLLFYELQKKK